MKYLKVYKVERKKRKRKQYVIIFKYNVILNVTKVDNKKRE